MPKRYRNYGANHETAWVRVEDDAVVLAVRDTGEGIAPDDLPHVWEHFYRAKNANGSGAGLDLALVKELAETMRGTVSVNASRQKALWL